MEIRLCLLSVLCVMAFMPGCTPANTGETKIPDRTYTISDFTKVELGMTYEKVVELMGEPTGSVGSGIVWQTYMLLDGSYVKLFFGSAPPYSDSWLVEIYIVDPSGREFELKQD